MVTDKQADKGALKAGVYRDNVITDSKWRS